MVLLSCVDSQQRDGSGPDMVLIPEGTFMMGGRSDQAYSDEFPRHKVNVSAFYMDATEVTNAQFLAFVEATGYETVAEREIDWEDLSRSLPPGTPKPPDSLLTPGSLVFKPTNGPVDLRNYLLWWDWRLGANWRSPEGPGSHIDNRMNHPVVHIAWEDASAYADWAGKRLPTEAEWEWASIGGDHQQVYPWGNTPIEEAAAFANFWQGFFPYDNQLEDGYSGTAPVKSYPPNAYGLYDMAGNVWEWCSDKYHVDTYLIDKERGEVEDPGGPERSFDPLEPYAEDKYVVRGGSFLCNDSYCSGYRSSRRMPSSWDSSSNHKGFRCVRSVR